MHDQIAFGIRTGVRPRLIEEVSATSTQLSSVLLNGPISGCRYPSAQMIELIGFNMELN
jgi:hypothetical protein